MVMLLAYSVSRGDMVCAVSCMASEVQAELRLKKTEETVLRVSPARSSASIVLAKVGGSGLPAMASISRYACRMASRKAGS